MFQFRFRRAAVAALAFGVAFGVAPLGFQDFGPAAAVASNEGGHSIGDWVKVTLRDGRSFTGRIVDTDAYKIVLELDIAGIAMTKDFARFDVSAIESAGDPEGEEDDRRGGRDRDRERDRDADRDRGADEEEPAGPDSGGYVLVSLDGEIGEEWTGDFVRFVLDRAESNDAEAVILHITSPGGYLEGLERVFEELDEDRDVEVVAYVDDECFSAAAILAMSCDKFFVGPRATFGAAVIWEREGDSRDAVDAKLAGAQVATWRSRVQDQGRPGVLVDAMALQESELWADKSTTPWTLYASRPGRGSSAEQLDDSRRVLSLTADEAVAMAAADGFARNVKELVDTLDLEEPTRVAWDAASHVRRHQSLVERTLEETWRVIHAHEELVANFGEGFDERTTRIDVVREVRKVRAQLKRIQRLSRQHEHVELIINRDIVDEWIAEMEELIDRIKDL